MILMAMGYPRLTAGLAMSPKGLNEKIFTNKQKPFAGTTDGAQTVLWLSVRCPHDPLYQYPSCFSLPQSPFLISYRPFRGWIELRGCLPEFEVPLCFSNYADAFIFVTKNVVLLMCPFLIITPGLHAFQISRRLL